jgi:8-oxo-dGTP diphosphatase
MNTPIRIRVCIAVVRDDKILLVPHFKTDVGDIQWVVPGGQVDFGENLKSAAVQEFIEETGYNAEVTGLLTVSEVVLPDKPYHSITIAYSDRITAGGLKAEADHPFGEKTPRWFSRTELIEIKYHPEQVVEQALAIRI